MITRMLRLLPCLAAIIFFLLPVAPLLASPPAVPVQPHAAKMRPALSGGTNRTPLLVPSQYPNIQAAVKASQDGDTVLVADNTYSGDGNRDIDFLGKNITVTSQNGPAKTIIDCGGYASTGYSGDHRGFYIHSGEKNATISGFTVKNGYITSDGGAGIYNLNVGVTVQNCTLMGNTANNGGGICNVAEAGDTIIVTNCALIGNTATNEGGGICNICESDKSGGSITITDCNITGNSAPSGPGGGVYNFNSSGGVIALIKINITGNTTNGFSTYYGGGGGGIYNDLPSGGGMIILTSCTITSNTTYLNGGGVNSYNNFYGTITLTNCTISGNTVNADRLRVGGGVSQDSFNGATTTLTNCTIFGNSAPSGGGLYNYNGFSTYSGTIALTNDIIYGDTGGEVLNDNRGTVPTATFSDVQGGYPGTNNIDADPQFVNAAAGDLHLKPGSPCLGAGTPSGAPATDLDGKQRPNPPSMGAYETSIATFTVTAAKFGGPSAIPDFSSGAANFIHYATFFSGSLSGPATGHWLLDNKLYFAEANFNLDFSQNQWQSGPGIDVPIQALRGVHTISFVVDTPNSKDAGIVRSAVTSFDPALNGWYFHNYIDTSLSGKLAGATDGVCVGMSVLAWNDYVSHIPIPSDFPGPSKSNRTAIKVTHFLGNSHIQFTDQQRLAFYDSGSQEIASETGRINQHLQHGDPWVVGLNPDRYAKGKGHAVVAWAEFDISNAYIENSASQQAEVERLMVYDPNFPRVSQYLDVVYLQGAYIFGYFIASDPPATMQYLYEY